MTMRESMSPELLARFFAGETSSAERAEVEAWADADPKHREELERLQAMWADGPAGQWDVDRAWARVASRLNEAPSVTLRPIVPSPRTWRLALAATVLLALGATFVWRAMTPAGPNVPQVLATLAGQQETIELDDGTTIILAAGSELRVAAEYGRDERRVDLAGEAWFEVTHDADRPFRVFAAGTVTEDLGTEFSVRARPEESLVRVTVVSGSTSLRRDGAPESETATLVAQDVGTLAADATRPTVERVPDIERLVAWHEGRLVFEDARLDSVAAELSRWYGKAFHLADPTLGDRRLTSTFRLEELDDAIDILALTLGVEIEHRADTVVIR